MPEAALQDPPECDPGGSAGSCQEGPPAPGGGSAGGHTREGPPPTKRSAPL